MFDTSYLMPILAALDMKENYNKYPYAMALGKRAESSAIAWRIRLIDWLEENMNEKYNAIWTTGKYDSDQRVMIFCKSQEDHVKLTLRWA